MRGIASRGGWGLSEETHNHFIRIRCEKLWLRSLIWISWFWDISCNLLTKTEALNNLPAAYFRERVFRGLVLAFHDFSGNNTEIILKENRKHFLNPRNFWGWEDTFPDQPDPEQSNTWGGIGVLDAVRECKWWWVVTHTRWFYFPPLWLSLAKRQNKKIYCIIWHGNISINVGRTWSCLQLTTGGSLCLFCGGCLRQSPLGIRGFPSWR